MRVVQRRRRPGDCSLWATWCWSWAAPSLSCPCSVIVKYFLLVLIQCCWSMTEWDHDTGYALLTKPVFHYPTKMISLKLSHDTGPSTAVKMRNYKMLRAHLTLNQHFRNFNLPLLLHLPLLGHQHQASLHPLHQPWVYTCHSSRSSSRDNSSRSSSL